uniref:Chloroplast envelope membrane protein n=1 Tax=Caulerpa serrulata TaxID=177068 RepID=A0A6B9UCS4_9CHLO|nr:chloroplast envelope membrane protein [Caulerpa serrulata]
MPMRSNSEQLGWIPRSIIRTFQRFFKQIGFQTDLFAIYEFRVSRYFAIASLQCFFFLILCPWIFQFFMKVIVFKCLEEFSTPVFLNFHQQEQALEQLNNLDAQIYFDTLINYKTEDLILEDGPAVPAPSVALIMGLPCLLAQVERVMRGPLNPDWISQTADFYSKQSFDIITNWILDLTTLLFFLLLLFLSKPQIIIFKTFLVESLFSLSETTKCFFLIFFLDLLVGFHSSKSWEVFLQFVFEHFGFQINQNFIFFFISTFPVFLDTIFKYWIFRYLNKISPSTVATYQAMIE